MDIIKTLAKELKIQPWQVENAVKLIDEGNTIPFISRYRKEATGELNDEVLRALDERLAYLRSMEERKADVKRIIEEQGKLAPELAAAIDRAEKLTEVEDLYRPFRPKRKTRATVAKAKGLEPLAELIRSGLFGDGDIEKKAAEYVSEEKGVLSAEEAIGGAMDIIAESISDNAEYRKKLRDITFRTGVVVSKASNPEEESVYEMYYDFTEGAAKIAPHRVLAIDRGEKEKILSVSIVPDTERIMKYLSRAEDSGGHKYLEAAVQDAYKRLIAPSIEREIRNELTENAREQAIGLFKTNLRNLLMQPLIKDKVVIGLDPGYRTGCKVGVVDGTGKVLDTGVIYITNSEARKRRRRAF